MINKKFRINKLSNFKNNFVNYERWLNKEGISNQKFFCINFILAYKINNIVIGLIILMNIKFQNLKEHYVNPPNFVKINLIKIDY